MSSTIISSSTTSVEIVSVSTSSTSSLISSLTISSSDSLGVTGVLSSDFVVSFVSFVSVWVDFSSVVCGTLFVSTTFLTVFPDDILGITLLATFSWELLSSLGESVDKSIISTSGASCHIIFSFVVV